MSEPAREALREQGLERQVLLVEDVASMRLYLGYALQRHGVRVVEAENLASARRLLRSGLRPSSVLLDLELPDGNGLDLLPEVPGNVPIVALTGDDSSATARRCREAGCTLVLSKSGKLGGIAKVLGKVERDWHRHSLPRRQQTELADRYFEYLRQSLAELKQAEHDQDLESARRIAHRLRGTAVHFGYGIIGACAGELGKAIASGEASVIGVSFETLVEHLADAVEGRNAAMGRRGSMPG